MPVLFDKFECFKAIFGAYYAMRLACAGFRELEEAAESANHRLMADMSPPQRDRLKAVLRLARLWYPEQEWTPSVLTGIGDVVRLIQPRCATLTDRVIWLLPLDASDVLSDEVLVQVGGDPLKPPPLRTLLRHALFKGAVSVWICDYRPVEKLDVPAETAEAFAALVQIGALIGVEICDWVLFGPSRARSVSEQIADGVSQLPLIHREAA